MNSKMFSKITNLIQQAVETFSTNVTPQEEFVYHWKCITGYFVDSKDGRKRIEETAIGGHVDRMLEILQHEETDAVEVGTTGPCLEYLLQHRILDTLCTLGRTDQPPGMKQVVLAFFTRLLSRLRHPLLPHINVYRAVQRLVKACGEVKAAPTEKEEIEFLCTVCAKIKSDPYLVNFFLENSPNRRRDEKSEAIKGDTVTSPPKTGNSASLQFGLVDALINLAQSEDAWVAVKACEGLMLCASLPEPTAAACLVERTDFCKFLAHRLVTLYSALPISVTPSLIEGVEAKWGFDTVGEKEEEQGFVGRRRVVALLSWLDYVDRVAEAANPTVAIALSRRVAQELFQSQIEPALLQTAEAGIIVATAYLTRFLRTVCSEALLRELTYFMLGNERIPESVGEKEPVLRYRLLERCNHLSEEVCLVTLRLFDTLLQKEEEHIFHNMVLRNLLGRNYLKTVDNQEGQAPSVGQGSAAGSVEALPEGDSPTSPTADSSDPAPHLPPDAVPPSPTRAEVHKIVNSFLYLLPEEAKSSYETADSSYDMYLKDAHKQYAGLEAMCKGWGWPTRVKQYPEEFKQQTFFEGSFLRMLFNKLDGMLNQSHAVNLLVTGLAARLALIPHPVLHEFLLDPFLPIAPGVHTLFTKLTKVSNDLRSHMKCEPDFSQKLLLARKQLLGITYNIQSAQERFEEQSRYEAVIVLEEFCKELSAIAFVKHHAAIIKS